MSAGQESGTTIKRNRSKCGLEQVWARASEWEMAAATSADGG